MDPLRSQPTGLTKPAPYWTGTGTVAVAPPHSRHYAQLMHRMSRNDTYNGASPMSISSMAA